MSESFPQRPNPIRAEPPFQSFYDAVLILSYGGPENEAEVGPFLDRLFAGKNLPPAARRRAEEKYRRTGSVSPIGREGRLFADRLRGALREGDFAPPPDVYLGNLYAPPLLEETVRKIVRKGHRSILTLAASPFGSPQSCRRYRDRLEKGISDAASEGAPDAASISSPIAEIPPTVPSPSSAPANASRFHMIPPFFRHPRFIKAQGDLLLSLMAEDELDHFRWGPNAENDASSAEPPLLLFSAHSLPEKDAAEAGYEAQLLWASEKIAASAGLGGRIGSVSRIPHGEAAASDPFVPSASPAASDPFVPSVSPTASAASDPSVLPVSSVTSVEEGKKPGWNLVYQSRSGRDGSPWTGPEIIDFIRADHSRHPKRRRYLIMPIGFFFENMETAVDLDRPLSLAAAELNLEIRRAPTVARSPAMIEMILDLLKSEPPSSPCGSPPGTCRLACQSDFFGRDR